MRIRLLTLSALMVQLVLGNLCMMQMAYASETTHDMHMEMMPTADDQDCEHCPKQDEDAEEETNAMDCSSGHCFMHAKPAESGGLQVPTPLTATDVPQTLPATLFATKDPFNKPRSTAPPRTISYTKTIVLIF